MIDYDQPEAREATLLERLTAAGIDPDRARTLIVGGGVRVAGCDEPVVDPEASVPKPTAWYFATS